MMLPPTRSQQPRVWLAEIAVVGMALIWGVNYSVIKFGTSVVPPSAFNGARVTFAALFLMAIALTFGGRIPARRDILALLALGFLGNGIYQTFFAEGIARTRAGEAALVVGASPALIALLSRMAGVDRVSPRAVFGIALSISGVGLVVLGRAAGGDVAPGGSLFGDLLALCASICWAVYTVLVIPYTKRVSGFYVVAFSMAGGAAFLLVVGMPSILSLNWAAVPGAAYLAILYGGFGALGVAYLFWLHGVKVLGPTQTAVFANLQPMIALAIAWITLHERPTLWQVIGAVTIVGGVLLTRTPVAEAS